MRITVFIIYCCFLLLNGLSYALVIKNSDQFKSNNTGRTAFTKTNESTPGAYICCFEDEEDDDDDDQLNKSIVRKCIAHHSFPAPAALNESGTAHNHAEWPLTSFNLLSNITISQRSLRI